MNYLIVFLGGGLGAAARYGMNIAVGRLIRGEFPWHTLLVNVLGCLVMGVLTEAMALRLNVSQETRLFLVAGVLGGFTTFSAFALDFALLVGRRDLVGAGFYAIASVLLSIAACFAGLMLVRSLFA